MGNTGDTANLLNGPDTGAVNYEYSIGKYEVTSDQWASVAGFDALVENSSNDPWTGSQPTANANWYEAAKFANWLTSGNALQGAYTFSDSTTFTGVDRDTALTTFGTIYVLPTDDEWYKAAYLKSDGSGYTLYPTGDSVPTAGTDANYNFVNSAPWNVGSGSLENNGTYDMGGNVSEWSESAFDGTLDDPDESRVQRGGIWAGNDSNLRSTQITGRAPGLDNDTLGFRVVALGLIEIPPIPEPSSTALLGLGGLALMLRRRR